MPSTPEIRSVIRKALLSKGWKGITLAKELDVSPSTVSRWINGQSDPDTQLWPQIEQVLDLPDSTLLNAKYSSMVTEYQDSRVHLLEKAKERLRESRSFDTFQEFYAKFMDSDFSIRIIAELTNETPKTVAHWIANSEPPPTHHWATIEKHYQLGKGTFKRIADKESGNHITVDPDKVAAHGDLKDEDRPAIAAMLQQVLEQQAQIVKRLDELDPDK